MKKILLIVTGSIAAYKALELIRVLRKDKIDVTVVMTSGAKKFITEMSFAAISGNPVYSDLFSLKDETEMGHIKLARENDLVVVAPASADIIAKMALGMAGDLASTILLATEKKVLVVPAMNVTMWSNKAVARNVAILKEDGIAFVEPQAGDLACGESGIGRMADLDVISSMIKKMVGWQ